MEGSRRICVLIIVFVCSMQDFASGSNILQGPQNVTVLAGSNASFNCTVQAGWKSISWYLQDVYVVTISSTAGTIVSNNHIAVQNSTNNINGDFTTEISIINVNKSNSGTVRCSSLSASFQDAYLTVQVKGLVQVANGSSVTVTPNSSVSISCQASGWYPAPTITWNLNNTAASSIYYSTVYTTGTDGLVSAVSTFTIILEADTNLTCLAIVQMLDAPVSTTVTIAVRENIPGSSSGLSKTAIILIAVFASIGGLLLLLVLIAVIVIFCCKKKKKKKETGYQSDAWRAPQQDVSNLRTIDRASLGEHNYAFTFEPLSVAPSFRTNHSDSAFSEATTTPKSNISQVNGLDKIRDHLKKTRHVTHV
ncbi:immunoglobulin superfamily member 5 [Pyxicephalus adspersus]